MSDRNAHTDNFLGSIRMTPRFLKNLLLVVVMNLVLAACGGGKAVTFQSYEPGSVITLVPLENPNGTNVEKLTNPVTLEPGKFLGKAVKVSAAGKAPQFWFAPDDVSQKLDVKIKNLGVCDSNEVNKNLPLRLLLRAYQALSSRDFNLARELCTKAAVLDPSLAAPHIITGLTFFQEGKREDARVAFNKASALDPDDAEISQLLRMVQ